MTENELTIQGFTNWRNITNSLNENKKLQRFLALDRNARKRIRSGLEFLRAGPSDQVRLFWEEHASTVS